MNVARKKLLIGVTVLIVLSILICNFSFESKNNEVTLRIGTGTDISKVLVEETLKELGEENIYAGFIEFGDC